MVEKQKSKQQCIWDVLDFFVSVSQVQSEEGSLVYYLLTVQKCLVFNK